MSSRSPVRSPGDAKARLFCQQCGHESPPDGDWEVRTTADGTDVSRCPVCGYVVDERPALDDTDADDTDANGRSIPPIQ